MSHTLQVQVSTQEANPFYGLRNCLNIFQNGSKGNISIAVLDAAYNEVKDNKQHRELFFILLFSIGDITARQHNIFRGNKVDNGGNAQRNAFTNIYEWLKTKHYKQWLKFLSSNLFNEYVSFDLIFANRVQTQGKKKVKDVISNLSGSEQYINDLVEFARGIIKGKNPSDKYFLAKFLTRPRTSKRKGHKVMLPETKQVMEAKVSFLLKLSQACGFEVVKKANHYEFPGYINWRKEFIGDMESVMFSSKKVLEFDRDGFIGWLEKLPSGARFRVRTRLLNKDNSLKEGKNWSNLGRWFLEWESYKETKQQEQRVLENKVKQGTATAKDVQKLEVVKKEAKVNVGAISFDKMFVEIIKGSIDKVKVQPFLDKINLPYNTLVFMDDSSSMQSYGTNGITAFDMACFIATICLTKNPDEAGRSLVGMFSQRTFLYNLMTSQTEAKNKLVIGETKQVRRGLIDPEAHFLDNLRDFRAFAHSKRTGNLTNISSIATYLEGICQQRPETIEELQEFPVWTLISDGNFNNLRSPEASLNDLLRRLESFLGFKPYLIIIDVASSSSAQAERFSGIENVMYIPPNPASIEQFLMNYRDFKVYDIYTPLESMYNSNRYAPIKEAVL